MKRKKDLKPYPTSRQPKPDAVGGTLTFPIVVLAADPETDCKVFFFRIIIVLMILPQVHLRKPCYDFSFL